MECPTFRAGLLPSRSVDFNQGNASHIPVIDSPEDRMQRCKAEAFYGRAPSGNSKSVRPLVAFACA